MKKCYSMDNKQVFEQLKTKKEGITSDEASQRLKEYGYNEFREVKGKTLLQKFIEQLKDFMILILVCAAVLSVIATGGKDIVDAIIILSIVVLNAVLGVVQENKAEESLKALKKMASPNANVYRDGQLTEIPARQLVPGDIVALEAGKYVPADLRIIESYNLKIDESSLTGESVPVDKGCEALEDKDISIGDRSNMGYMSTLVTYGRGKGVIVSTGMNTEIGNIANMISNVEETSTPLQKKLGEAGKWMGIGAILICLMIFMIGVIRRGFKGDVMLEMFMTAVSLAVAAIPEGMPAVVTIVLAVGVQKMIKRNAIIKKLPAVETLGCATVICSDKTGTLTQNKMTVKKAFVIDGFTEDKHKLEKGINIVNLCNDSEIEQNGNEIRTIGDPTETAFIDMAMKLGIDKRKLDEEYKRDDEIPFDSERKLMTTFNKDKNGYTVNVKGAPDIMLKRFKYVDDNGTIREITKEDIDVISRANESMANEALRVLCAGYKHQDEIDKENAEKDLVFSALFGMIDPPREEAKSAVERSKTAGIKPVMITGDHKATAVAIAKELGILKDDKEAVTGADLENMSQRELEAKVAGYSVYARVSPEHKVRIVEAWKSKRHIVAMTGDGVNDAPALKKADIGAAMGITGTDVAKEAADMILTDDNFSTIVDAVEEGRTVYTNIRKSLQYLLSCNTGEIITLFIATLFNWAEPLLPIHILWVNLVTDSLPALALGMEPPEEGVMKMKPRKAEEGIFANHLGTKIFLQGILIGGVTLCAYWIGLMKGNEVTARSMAFFTLSMSQLIHSYNVRHEKSVIMNGMFKNKYLNYAFITSMCIQCIVLATPFTRRIFKVELVSLPLIGMIVACAVVPLVIVEIVKLIFHAHTNSKKSTKGQNESI